MKRLILIGLVLLCSCASIRHSKTETEAKKERKAFVISVCVLGVWVLAFNEFGE